jgi:hypothetical protein
MSCLTVEKGMDAAVCRSQDHLNGQALSASPTEEYLICCGGSNQSRVKRNNSKGFTKRYLGKRAYLKELKKVKRKQKDNSSKKPRKSIDNQWTVCL